MEAYVISKYQLESRFLIKNDKCCLICYIVYLPWAKKKEKQMINNKFNQKPIFSHQVTPASIQQITDKCLKVTCCNGNEALLPLSQIQLSPDNTSVFIPKWLVVKDATIKALSGLTTLKGLNQL